MVDIYGSMELISIHALREEGDRPFSMRTARSLRFLSTPSARRATAGRPAIIVSNNQFLSTPSARRATVDRHTPRCFVHISIHALREEGDFFVPNRLLWQH